MFERRRTLWACAAGYAFVVASIGILRYVNLWAWLFDIGLFDQAAWLLARGETFVTIANNHAFVDHVSPAIVLTGVLYLVAPTPITLIVVQAIAVAAAMFPMRRIVASYELPQWIAPVSVALSGPLFAAATFDFHMSTLAVLATTWVIAGMREDNTRITLIAALCLVALRADMLTVLLGLVVVSSGAVRIRLLLGAVVGGVLSAMPALFGHSSNWITYYENLGSSPMDALLHPWRALQAIVSLRTAQLLTMWLVPFALLPLLRIRWCIAVVIAASPMILSQQEGVTASWTQYGAYVWPLVCVAAFEGYTYLNATVRRRAVLVVAICAVLSFVLLSPLAPGTPEHHSTVAAFRKAPQSDYTQLADVIPDDAAVSVDVRAGTAFAQRRYVYPFPCPLTQCTRSGPNQTQSDADRIQYVVLPKQRAHQGNDLGFTQVVAETENFVALIRAG